MASLTVELEQEVDGRWIAEIPAVPGVLVYGTTPEGARAAAQALAAKVFEDLREQDEVTSTPS